MATNPTPTPDTPTPLDPIVRRTLTPPPPPSLSAALIVNPGLPVDGSLARAPHTTLAPRPDALFILRQFVDPAVIAEAFDDAGWSPRDEVNLYVDLIRDAEVDPRIRIAAAKALHQMATKALLLSGDVATATVTRTKTSDDGTTHVEQMATIVRRSQAQSALQPTTAPTLITEVSSDVQHSADADADANPDHESPQAAIPTAIYGDRRGSYHAAPDASGSSRRRGLATGPSLLPATTTTEAAPGDARAGSRDSGDHQEPPENLASTDNPASGG